MASRKPVKGSSLVDTLLAIQNVSEQDILAADNIQPVKGITIADPPPSLLYRVEPNFVMGYDIDTEALWDAYVRGENIMVVGPSGTGKSSLAYHLLDNANEGTRKKNRETYEKNLKILEKGGEEKDLLPYKPIPYETSYLGCGSGTRVEQVIGTLKFKATENGREPYTVLGAVVDAWVNGKTLIIDEMDFASPDTWGELHQFFDGRTQVTTIYINGPEVIRKNPKFRVIATANTFGQGENQMDFAGTQLLNSAFLNRFTYKVELDYLQSDKEADAIMCNYSAAWKSIVIEMVRVAGKVRRDKASGILTRTISTRDLLAWTRECLDREKRLKLTRTSTPDYWHDVVIPSALPTFLTGNPDASVVLTYLEVI